MIFNSAITAIFLVVLTVQWFLGDRIIKKCKNTVINLNDESYRWKRQCAKVQRQLERHKLGNRLLTKAHEQSVTFLIIKSKDCDELKSLLKNLYPEIFTNWLSQKKVEYQERQMKERVDHVVSNTSSS